MNAGPYLRSSLGPNLIVANLCSDGLYRVSNRWSRGIPTSTRPRGTAWESSRQPRTCLPWSSCRSSPSCATISEGVRPLWWAALPSSSARSSAPLPRTKACSSPVAPSSDRPVRLSPSPPTCSVTRSCTRASAASGLPSCEFFVVGRVSWRTSTDFSTCAAWCGQPLHISSSQTPLLTIRNNRSFTTSALSPVRSQLSASSLASGRENGRGGMWKAKSSLAYLSCC